MRSDHVRLFIDANIFIAAASSPTGGSSVILKLCRKSSYKAVTTELILEEARRNLKKKFSKDDLKSFYNMLKSMSIEIQPPPENTDKYKKVIEEKDAHVLASAVESNCDYLVTLDRKHFFTDKIKKAKLKIKIVTPKDLINELYKKEFK